MPNSRTARTWPVALLFVALTFGCVGCANETDQQRRDREEKMRQDAADAIAKTKPALEAAGKEIDRAADRAVDDARAAAEGVREGWSKGDDGRERLNLNAAGESDLLALPGITKSEARLIIQDRPYADKHDLVAKGIITEQEYLRIRDQVVAK
jgi:DNA uptake protein ComE-like DNA-binding protein